MADGDAKEKSTPEARAPANASSRPPRPMPRPLNLPILKHLRSKRVILASASPRRRALLAQVGLTNLEIIPSTKPEDADKSAGPHAYVSATANQKVLDVYQSLVAAQDADSRLPDPALVISADTIVVSRDGRILEKPRSRADHVRTLRHLRDTRVHTVMTSVCVLAPREDARFPGYDLQTHTEETKVYFAAEEDGLPDDVIEAYVDTGEGADKAGGYALQGVGGMVLVERVDGSVDNVVGLPVRRCLALAEKVVFRQDEEEGEESAEE
ncbi:related to septum formation maf [Cephalotrichum gorgonifer]|uniref:Related to septum formation maf n=1 Tax=Cephalotrichum gorgonifer TaxID=2041049 RepID=A0AAE8MZR9_9PEZI|nr:related to septum formation maf [Cephalotrichum gorgonifer]